MNSATQPAGAPERIWLVIGEDCPADVRFDSLEEVTWCQDKIDDNSIEYVHADTVRAMMAERDAAREQSERWQKSMDALRDERDALRRELEELRAIPPDAREGREPLPEWRILDLARDNGDESDTGFCFNNGDWMSVTTFARAIEAAHGIGPAGTSADGETQP